MPKIDKISKAHKQIYCSCLSTKSQCSKIQDDALGFDFCFLASNDTKPLPNPTGAWPSSPDAGWSVFAFSELFEGWLLVSFTPFVSPLLTASGVAPEFIMLRSWVRGGKAWTGTPCGRIKRPLAAAFFLTSAAARAALSSTPLPRGRVSPIMAALSDLLTDPLELPDPPATAAAWNACIKSGWACHSCSKNQISQQIYLC